jgi:hypothetical protein
MPENICKTLTNNAPENNYLSIWYYINTSEHIRVINFISIQHSQVRQKYTIHIYKDFSANDDKE